MIQNLFQLIIFFVVLNALIRSSTPIPIPPIDDKEILLVNCSHHVDRMYRDDYFKLPVIRTILPPCFTPPAN